MIIGLCTLVVCTCTAHVPHACLLCSALLLSAGGGGPHQGRCGWQLAHHRRIWQTPCPRRQHHHQRPNRACEGRKKELKHNTNTVSAVSISFQYSVVFSPFVNVLEFSLTHSRTDSRNNIHCLIRAGEALCLFARLEQDRRGNDQGAGG